MHNKLDEESLDRTTRTIVVLNQHGENRGDEAAMRALVRGIERETSEQFRFVFLVQHRDHSLPLYFEEDVHLVNMVMPAWQAFMLLLYLPFFLLNLPFSFLLPKPLRVLVNAYAEASLILSAPGGPYFGDIYIKHEIVHWFFVWLASLRKTPIILYSPSAGPFESKLLNPVRRYLYKKFDKICFREETSGEHFSRLLPEKEYTVTADAALQDLPLKLEIKDFVPEATCYSKHVAISILDYMFSKEKHPELQKEQYFAAVQSLIETINNTEPDTCFLYFPQLYGNFHDDTFFIQRFISRMSASVPNFIVDGHLNSDMQRGLISACDFCLASRYHPQVFSISARVPTIALCYEHKSFGFMKLLELEDFALDIRTVTPSLLLAAYKRLTTSRAEVMEVIDRNLSLVVDRSRISSRFCAEFLR